MKTITLSIDGNEYGLLLSDSIQELEGIWNRTARRSIYYESGYLKILERCGPLGYKYYYGVLMMKGIPVAIFYFQHKTISLYRDFRLHSHGSNPFSKFYKWIQRQSFRLINQELLVAGNVLLTGEYAFFFTDRIEDSMKSSIYEVVFEETSSFIKEKTGRRIQSILAKDFYIPKALSIDDFHGKGFTKFHVQPDMILTIDPEWQDFNDYLRAVRSKYRVKFNKVMKIGKALEFRDLEYDDLLIHTPAIYDLYKHTSEKANFSLFTLHPDYFPEIKKVYKDRFKVSGVFLKGKLVAFFTLVLNSGNADAHFLGYDPSLNISHQIYFNILLKLVETAIFEKSQFLNLSRTALEIKSSVGAEPYAMNIYLRHNNSLFNHALPAILNFLVPENKWIQRSPFK